MRIKLHDKLHVQKLVSERKLEILHFRSDFCCSVLSCELIRLEESSNGMTIKLFLLLHFLSYQDHKYSGLNHWEAKWKMFWRYRTKRFLFKSNCNPRRMDLLEPSTYYRFFLMGFYFPYRDWWRIENTHRFPF